ncbi:3-mercaptopyruvate sulfurtransferase-like isoform X2 [Protopterus annectens]|uniref:3-mercaptopyruvate sulfurtransferase-like isoform X2 n=1 Tax=Protopterus annectens TaxID=7888 RepID=UPI001CFB26E1|nr:3-mercaptopyruvate sulfurtransferase-like isoform X2 [Protopterus annectens]
MTRLLKAVVSAKQLSQVIRSQRPGMGLQVLDVIPYPSKGDPRKDFEKQHLPGALLFDVDECRDKSSQFPKMLPSAEEFSQYVGNLGISSQTHVVVYDRSELGSFSAPRVWWMFRVFGHSSVSVLSGGFKKWLNEGHPVSSEIIKPTPKEFQAILNRSWVAKFEDMMKNIESKQYQVVDVRAASHFHGPEQQPSKDVMLGHIPGTKNLPYYKFLNEDGTMKTEVQLDDLLKENGVDLNKPLIASCWAGVTACHLSLAACLLDKERVKVYDGSWSEWSVRANTEHIIPKGTEKTM